MKKKTCAQGNAHAYIQSQQDRHEIGQLVAEQALDDEIIPRLLKNGRPQFIAPLQTGTCSKEETLPNPLRKDIDVSEYLHIACV